MSKLLFKTTLKGRVCIKKNSLQRKYSFAKQRTVTMASDRYLEWEDEAVIALHNVWRKRRPINQPIIMKALFYFKNHQHEPDLSNCYEGVQDALAKAGVISNDRIIQGHDGSRKIFGSEPRVEIELYALEEIA